MLETRTRILGIAPYEGMQLAMERVAQAYPNVQLDVHTGDLNDGVAIVQRALPNAYDCIISRGGTAVLIRQVTALPVIEIPLSVYDVLCAMKLAENYSKLYAIVGFPSITESAHTLCDLLDCSLDILTVRSAEEVSRTLERLKEGGYHMVVCDMVTHTIARRMGLDAFLITSGVESLHVAFDQALNISAWFKHLRQETLFLSNVMQGQNARVVVLDTDGGVFYSSPTEPSAELSKVLCSRLREIPSNGSLKFYYSNRDQLYSITAQMLMMDNAQYALFYCIPSRIPLHSNWAGLRFLNKDECEHLFMNSFFSISGAMGTLDKEIQMLAATRQPMMISGEPGTGKEQIAKFLYLRSSLVNNPFASINCMLTNEKSWDFLLNHYNSPLNASGNTVYFRNVEALSETRALELLAAIQETGLARRVRLIFSCACREGEPRPDIMRRFSVQVGCFSLNLPPLRSRSDEIPSLASLYLSSLNLEQGQKLLGFEPRAIELLRQYDWPSNYTQFKQVLQTLATLTTSAYIRSNAVAELLNKERSLYRSVPPIPTSVDSTRTLEEIICDVLQQTVIAHNGNRAAAARQLGISRTTMWRYLGKNEVCE